MEKKTDKIHLKRNLISSLSIFFFIFLFSICFISAAIENLGTFKQYENVNLLQTSDDATYVNITSIIAPDSSTLVEDVVMTKSGTRFNYTLGGQYTTQTGQYIVNCVGDEGGSTKTCTYYFSISPSGKSGSSNTVFYIFMIFIVYAITFIGFFGRHTYITIIGGMLMLFLGVYLFRYGIIIYRDNLTFYFSIFTMGLGAFAALYAGVEELELF